LIGFVFFKKASAGIYLNFQNQSQIHKEKSRMKKRYAVLLSVILIIAILAAGTFAYFSDQEKVVGNGFTAGSLDLQLGGAQSLPFSVGNVVPGDSGQGKVTLSNLNCTIPGTLNVSLANIVQSENGIIEPEQGLNGEYTPDRGELGMFLNFIAFIDVNQNGSFDPGDIQLSYNNQVLPYTQISYFAGFKVWENQLAWNNVMTLACGQSVDLVVKYEFPTESQDANYSQNIAQTDGLGFDVVFDLVQSH
jgi:predicted ribosomally synthesized peptide with SipW-like signal peptide